MVAFDVWYWSFIRYQTMIKREFEVWPKSTAYLN